ncbi:hypothetical protein LXL04_015690 [Taraxacum kok-saghyz]
MENGKILDCIGSSPGFEDGEFEYSKIMRPASLLYHDDDDCLYFVDSEVKYFCNLVTFASLNQSDVQDDESVEEEHL